MKKHIAMIRDYAQFGLFSKGQLISSGTIAELQNKAIDEIEQRPTQNYFISCIIFDNFDDPIEGTRVLSISKNKNDILITNELL